jgi:hypothetical protein
MTAMEVPSAITAYVTATNEFDVERMVAAFRVDAVVNDHRVELVGVDQIRAWAAREIVGDHVTMNVTSVRRIGDHVVLAAIVDGEFDKTNLPDPLVLTFYFSMSGDKIGALVIVHNKPADQEQS